MSAAKHRTCDLADDRIHYLLAKLFGGSDPLYLKVDSLPAAEAGVTLVDHGI